MAMKRILLGRPMSSGELQHTLLPKTIALPVFSSDPLSSVTYATQEVLLVLGTVGVAALTLVLPISFAVATLLAIVITSYRQTVKAYPSGGGAYRVTRENLGKHPGLLAASALLLDYVLTVSVSITAGVDAIVSAAPGMAESKIGLAIAFVAFVAFLNLRGVKESGVIFAIPTYGFLLSIYLMLATGFVKCLGGCPQAATATTELHGGEALTAFLILKAFAAGTTALTGVEAISDGVPAFRYPQSKNAAQTLTIMGAFSISMFLGISWLADNTNVVYEHGDPRTVVAQIADAVFAGGPLFYVVQVMSAAILILAANTAYQDFPRLSSILADDHFMPHQFKSRGDRLVFSNGIVILSVLAALLIVVFNADLNRLIQLYLVGVFISFTLSQTGMVLRTRALKPEGWRRTVAVSGFGAFVTGTVLFVIAGTKFMGGAWIVIAAIPVVMFTMHAINKHYMEVSAELAHPERVPRDRRPGQQHAVIYVADVNAASARAVGYLRSVRPSSIRAVSTDPAMAAPWRRLARDIPMDILPPGRQVSTRLKDYLRERRRDIASDDFLTVVTPEILRSRSLLALALRPGMTRLKASLLREQGVQVLDVPVVRSEIDPTFDEAQEPSRNFVVVLVSGVDNATLQAIEYAETLRPTDLRAVSFGLVPEESARLGDAWLEADIQHPLEIEASPFRDISSSLLNYLRQFRADGTTRVVSVVLPEKVVDKARHQLLHNQTTLVLKRRLLFERGVVLVSVPYHLAQEPQRATSAPGSG